MNKSVIPSDFNTDDDYMFTWFRSFRGVATVSLTAGGTLVFESDWHNLEIKNIGTHKETIVLKKAADLVM